MFLKCFVYDFEKLFNDFDRNKFCIEKCFKSCFDTAQECRGKTVQNRTGIMDLQNKSNILVAKQ